MEVVFAVLRSLGNLNLLGRVLGRMLGHEFLQRQRSHVGPHLKSKRKEGQDQTEAQKSAQRDGESFRSTCLRPSRGWDIHNDRKTYLINVLQAGCLGSFHAFILPAWNQYDDVTNRFKARIAACKSVSER